MLPRETNELIKRAVILLGIKVKNNRKKYPKLAAYIESRCCPTREGLNEILPFLSEKLLTIFSTGLELKKNQLDLIESMDMLYISGSSTGAAIGINKSIIRRDWATGKFNPRTENLDAFFDFIQTDEPLAKFVTPAKAGVQPCRNCPKTLDSGFRRNDDLLVS